MADATIRVDADTRGAERALGGLQKAIVALGVGVVAKQFAELSDQATNLRNRLNLVTSSVEDNNKTFTDLYRVAQNSRTPLSAVGDLFFRIARAGDSLGISNEQALQATNNVAKAITASGISAAEAAGPLLQLGQALQSGRLQGDELRSILEGLPPVARALAASMNVPIGALKELGAQGRISGRQVVDAILEAGDTIENDFGNTQATLEQGFIRVNNALVVFADELNRATGASATGSTGLERVSEAIEGLTRNIETVVNVLGYLFDALVVIGSFTLAGKILTWTAAAASALGSAALATQGAILGLTLRFTALGGRIGTAVVDFFAGLALRLGNLTKILPFVTNNFNFLKNTLAGIGIALYAFFDEILAFFQKIGEGISYLGDKIREILVDLGLLDVKVNLEFDDGDLANSIEEASKNTTVVFDPDAAKRAADRLKEIESAYAGIRSQLLPMVQAHQDYEDALFAIEDAFQEGLFNSYEDYNKAKKRLDQQYALDKIAAQEQISDLMDAYNDREMDAIIRRHEKERAEIEKTNRVYAIEQQRRIAAELKARGLSDKQAKDAAQDRLDFENKTQLERAQFAIEQGASVFNELGKANKKAFEAAKAFNIANAIMNTYSGATKALATYPPPFNFIAAAAVVAAGLAQVASIRSQQYSGRALGGPVMAGQSYIVGENGPEMFTPATSGGITRNQDLQPSNTNINFYIQTNDAKGFDQLLAERKPMIVNMIRTAQNDRGNMSKL